jgi:drug/metabolite transporter (DMT)-like permease
MSGWTVPAWRFDALLALVALGVLSTGVAYVLNYRIITDDGASTASLVTYLIPVTALVLGVIVLGEAATVHAIIGMVVVLIGVALAQHGVCSRITTDRGTGNEPSCRVPPDA